MKTASNHCLWTLVLWLTILPVPAQNVIMDGGEIYYRNGANQPVPYPPEYAGFAVKFYFAGRNPFPDGRFSDIRIACRKHEADSVERSPTVTTSSTSRPGFWTALKRGQSYDFFWVSFLGQRSIFGSWTVPTNAPRWSGLNIALDSQAKAVKFETVSLPIPPAAPKAKTAPSSASAAASVLTTPTDWRSIVGTYYGTDAQGITHYWDFNADGTFLHRLIGVGALGYVRNSERGKFALSGTDLTLITGSSTTSFSQASVTSPGGTVSGGGASSQTKTRHAKAQIKIFNGEHGLVLDGVDLKPRHGW